MFQQIYAQIIPDHKKKCHIFNIVIARIIVASFVAHTVVQSQKKTAS